VKQLRSTLNSLAYRLAIATAWRNWQLLLINLSTNLLSALLEGSTLGVVYLAISVLSTGSQQQQSSSFLKQILSVISLPSEFLFLGLLGMAVLLQALLALCNYGNKLSTAYLSARIQPQITGRVFEQIMAFSFDCASRYKVGDLVNYATQAAFTVNQQIQSFNSLVINLSFSLVYIAILVILSPVLALLAVLLAVFMVVVQKQLLPRLHKVVQQLSLTQVELAEQMTENIQALRLLHTFGTQQQATHEVSIVLQDVQRQLRHRARIFYLPEPILDTLPILSLAVLAAIAYTISGSSESTLSLLITFLLALQRLTVRVRGVLGAFTQMTDNSANMNRLSAILDPGDKQFALIGKELFSSLESDICFEGVSLSYANDQSYALQNLNFRIPRNQVTALVGQSGAGKSSIVDLLIGLYQPSTGIITVNDSNLQHYNQTSWRQRIGVVSQDTFIFNRSILDNLRYGSPEATVEDVIRAAQAAQAHQFILDLPEGYETRVGERGYRLSGGQRQRLALARAILKQPEILILDEATSALDSESERLIQQALADFQRDRTVIVVAHRLSTIMEAEQILVFEKGRLVEQGHHKSLLRKQGRYAHYWSLQTQGAAV
jgi:ATP-binding cassette, subfamily B, bacterial MsbA